MFLAGCYNQDVELIPIEPYTPMVDMYDDLEYAISLEKVPVIAFGDAKGKSIGDLLDNGNYMAYAYGGLEIIHNEKELEALLLERLENFDSLIGIHYVGEEPPLVLMEERYKEWMNSHNQISATILGYYYFFEPLSNGFFISIVNDFTMSRADLELVHKKFDQILLELNLEGLSDLEKVKILYQYVMDRMSYVSNGQNAQHSPMGFIFHGEGVCQAYAISLHLLLEKAGIESRYIIGEIHEELVDDPTLAGHAWNLVKLDGNWYHLDATWDDEEPEWQYFLLSDTGMSFSRSWETQYYEKAEMPYTNY